MSPTGPLNRRQVVAGAIAGAIAGPVAGRAQAETPSLGALARRCGIAFGAAFDLEAVEDPDYGALIRRHSTHTGNTNAFKYDWLRNSGPQADFTRADRLLRFAEEARLPFTAAVLFWNDWPPAWLKTESLARIRYLFDAHIDEVMPRYAGRIAQWVVVNEPFAPWDKEPGTWRKGPWYAAFGPDYVERAFRRARAADPKARLMLNEAFCERRDWIGAAVRPALLGLVERMKDSGVPLDTVGLQGHVQPQFGLDHHDYADLMRRLAAFGVALEITELDVDDAAMTGTLANRDGQVARHYREFLDAVLQVPQLTGVTTWGLADRYTWYHEVARAENALFPRQPRPLPFDERLAPKPAFAAIAAAFEAGARTR
ncbi:MAG: endo-1,4-beta-xylanase [Hyphomicrobiaceae bacterium]